METDYAAVPCNSLIPAFSFPTEYKIDIKLYGTLVHFNLIYICYIFIFSLELRINPYNFIQFTPTAQRIPILHSSNCNVCFRTFVKR